LNPEAMSDIKRVINVPTRGIGKVTILKLFSGEKSSLPSGVREKVDSFYRLLSGIGDKARKDIPSSVVKYIIKTSGLEDQLKGGTEEEQERLENMMELVTLATKYDNLPIGEGIEKLLEDAALASDQDTLEKNENAVKLMTVHASKGLEFDIVFIAGLEEGLFPHERQGSRRNEADMEEERRLFYVALTRARKKLYLSYAEMRMIYGNTQMNIPSQFLADIDAEYLEEEQGFAWSGKIVYLDL
ncbi:MAG: ATP-dependent helicase, partial [Candidatus Paceibacterota bacterium]